MKAYRLIAGLVLLGFLPQATYAQAAVAKPISELPKPTLVQENRATLLERGCVEVAGDTAAQTVAQPADKPVHLYPNDWTAGKYVFCPESVKDTVTIKEGKVLAIGMIIVGGIIISAAAYWILAGGVSDTVKDILFFTISYLLQIVGVTGVIIVDFVSRGAEHLLTVGGFTKNLLVIRAWPLVQGLVNIGFLIALIYIAILVVLRIGEGWSKLLPRLIIAALLLNFSLVFGGILIDASRVIMAAELKLLWGPAGPSDVPFGLQILARSKIFDGAFTYDFSRTRTTVITETTPHAGHDPGTLFQKALAVLLIWVLVFGLLYLAVGLVMRYVALVLLLAVSPVAYLGIAMPNLGGVAKQWWSLFWKYLIYGPIALFFLVMLAIIPRSTIGSDIISDLLMMAVTAGLLYAGIQVPKRIGGMGAGLVTGAAQRVAGFARQRPALAAGVALGVATGGASLLAAGAGAVAGYGAYKAGAYGAKRGYREVRDYVKERTRGVRETLGLGEYSKYDPRTGQARPEYAATGLKARAILATNAEARAAKDVTSKAKTADDLIKTTEKEVPVIDPVTGKQKTKKERQTITDSAGRSIDIDVNVPVTRKEKTRELVPELQYDKLAKKNVLDVLNEDELGKLGEAALTVKNKQVLKVMVQNEVVVRNMPTSLKAKLMASEDHPDISDMLNRTMRNISYKDAAK